MSFQDHTECRAAQGNGLFPSPCGWRARLTWARRLLAVLLLVIPARAVIAEAFDGATVSIPGEFSAPGEVWIRCYVQVPDSWAVAEGLLAESVSITLEGVVDAAELFVNGTRVGQCGTFPPQEGLSAREEWNRWKIAPGILQAGVKNAIVVHLASVERPPGLMQRAPVLAGYHEEVVLSGLWQMTRVCPAEGDWLARAESPAAVTYEKRTPATSSLRRPRELQRGAHLPPSDAWQRMRPAAGLAVDLVLAEPQIAQPLSLDFDARGRLWVVEYRQYPFPAGLRMTSRDKYYRAAYDQVPQPPPHHVPGADRISIHADQDGDGVFETHAVFVDGLNIASSLEIDNDGVWVLNPPYLLFYPDRNQDDIPDGDPEVHLEGFGLEDVHSVANSLTYGPDGWLYGAQGSTTSSRVRVRGTSQPPVYRDGAMVWRYHPRRRVYEIFAEGGGNAFGLEIDAQGRLFTGHNGGNTRGFHYVQGGYYQKGSDDKYGPLSNPAAFGFFPPMPHGAVERFSHDWIKYEGLGLPQEYAGAIFAVDPLHRHVICADLAAWGATFRTADRQVVLATDDLSFRPVEIVMGPDGAVYIADFCEEYIAHGQHYQGQIDPATGRVYRLRSAVADNHRALHELALLLNDRDKQVAMLTDPDRAVRRLAWKLLKDQPQNSLVPELKARLRTGTGQEPLEILWLLAAWGRLDRADWLACLEHAEPQVRVWAIRLLADTPSVDPAVAQSLTRLASVETAVEVRAQLACSARRLPPTQGRDILVALLPRAADLEDPYLPLLQWWAWEFLAGEWALVEPVWKVPAHWQTPMARQFLLERLMRRYANGRREELEHCAMLLDHAPDAEIRQRLLGAFEAAFAGRAVGELPESVRESLRAAGGGSVTLRVRLHDAAAIAQVAQELAAPTVPLAQRLAHAQLLGEIHHPAAAATLLEQLRVETDATLQRGILSALETYDQSEIGEVVDAHADHWDRETQAAAWTLLASRPMWALRLIARLQAERPAPATLTVGTRERLQLLSDPAVRQAVLQLWPRPDDGDEDRALQDARQRATQALASGDADPYRGRELFRETCARCHQLFREGGQIGPDLTVYPRDDTNRLLLQVTHPSLEIREGFELWTAVLNDGRVAQGFVFDQDQQVIVLRTAEGQTVSLAREDVDSLERSPRSLMPAGLLNALTDQQIRDLFGFLRLSQPLNEPTALE